MKKKCSALLFLLAFSICSAQQWDWAIQEYARKLAVDSAGNVFFNNDSTIKKFDPNGVFQWKKKVFGDLIICGLAADNPGNLYIAGTFTDFIMDNVHFVSSGNRDGFFCKINTAGKLLWSKTIVGPGDDYITDLYLNKEQKIFLCGHAEAGAAIENTLFPNTQFFTSRYDVNGNMELMFDHSGGEAWEVSDDVTGNIYLLGGINMNDTLDFGNAVILYGCGKDTCKGTHFIAKFNSAGTILWAKDLGSNYYQPFQNLAVDNNGNFYLTKWQRYGGFDLSKFDGTGNFIWKYTTQGIYGSCYSVCIDNNNSIWATGDIWEDPFRHLPFIWEFDPSDKLAGAIPATILASGNNIANDHNNNIYVSGTFKDTAIFGVTTLFATTGNYFLAKRNQSTISTSLNTIYENPDSLFIFPNPSTGIFSLRMNSNLKNAEINIFDQSGKCIYYKQVNDAQDHQIDLFLQNKGIYIYRVIANRKVRTGKIIIQ